MDTKKKLESDLKQAMRANDAVAKRTIRMALTAIKLAEIDKGGDLDEGATLAILQKEIKGRRETIADAQKANRPDMVAAAEEEISFLEQYLPRQLSPQELDDLARAAVTEAGATTPADMGKVMKILLPRTLGRATGDQVSQAVRKFLQAG
ncbi:MAG TPA: GatB/YqeY domain-containing protein [Anaerolineaceae bacterium]|nr:GatB/YqeY domain-containing protein [Anaerolineaceae bacterium]